MQSVTLIENIMDPETWERFETEDFRAAMVQRFPTWPSTARIYAGVPAQENDVTPTSIDEVDELAQIPELTVILYPEGPVAIIIAVVVAIALVALTIFLLPKISLDNRQTTSANNSLSQRGNQARINSRIPDIYGQVRSTPDLIAVPYRVFDDNKELEISYMCIGRGSYLIEEVRDGDTLISDIDGASAAVYGPFHSPNEGLPPDLQIGTAIGDPVFNVARLNEVNGQVLKASNDETVRSDSEIRFKDGGIIEAAGGSIDFTEFFEPDDEIVIGRSDTDVATAPVAIQVAAVAAELDSGGYGKLVFAGGYNPTADFTEGQTVLLSQAVWVTTTGGGTGGDLGGGQPGGGDENPDFPGYQFPDVISGD